MVSVCVENEMPVGQIKGIIIPVLRHTWFPTCAVFNVTWRCASRSWTIFLTSSRTNMHHVKSNSWTRRVALQLTQLCCIWLTAQCEASFNSSKSKSLSCFTSFEVCLCSNSLEMNTTEKRRRRSLSLMRMKNWRVSRRRLSEVLLTFGIDMQSQMHSYKHRCELARQRSPESISPHSFRSLDTNDVLGLNLVSEKDLGFFVVAISAPVHWIVFSGWKFFELRRMNLRAPMWQNVFIWD